MSPITRAFSTVRQATTLATARPAYAAGIRAAIATVGPLLVATMVGSDAGTWLALGGFNAAVADRGGSYRDRAVTLAAVTMGTALAMLVGSLAGRHIWIAVPVTIGVAFVASLARVWGLPGASIGGGTLSTFVIALAYPTATLSQAFSRTGFAMIGGAWAMVVALILWPLRPYRPARVAVAACYTALGGLIDEIVATMSGATDAARPEVPVGSAVVRSALEHARDVLIQLRQGRPGSSGRGDQLTVLGDISDQLFGHVAAVTESIEAIPPSRRDPAAQLIVLQTFQMIAETMRGLAMAVLAERDAMPVPLGWNGGALRALVSATCEGDRSSEATLHYLHAAAILDRAARFAETAVTSAAALSNVPGATGEHPVSTDATLEEDRQSPLAVVRAILTPESVIVRYAARVAVVLAVAVLLTELLGLRRGYWMSITVIVIMQPYTGATTQRALQRVIGTVVGGILAALLGTIFHAPAAILVLSFILAATCVALMPVNYAAYSVFLTPTFVLLAEASAGEWNLAQTRVINTLLGGVLAMAGARLLWPSSEWNRLPRYMAAALRANADYLALVGALFDDRSDAAGESMRAARRRIGLAMVNAEESFQRLLGEHRGPSDDLAPAASFITYSRRFMASTASLALARYSAPPTTADAVRSFTDASSHVLRELADSIDEGRAPVPLAMVSPVDEAEAPLPPLLRARAERLARQLRMLQQSVEREHEPARR